MANQDWNNIGNQIKDIVSDAVNSQDYSQLNQTITRAITGVMDSVNKGVQQTQQTRMKAMEEQQKRAREQQHFTQQNANPAGTQTDRTKFTQIWINQPDTKKNEVIRGPYANTAPMRTKGYLLSITGGVLSVMFGVSLLVSGIVQAAAGGAMLPLGLFTVCTVLSLGATGMGVQKLSLAKRFKNYVRLLQDKGYCALQDLANGTGSQLPFVKKDIRKMLRQGLFLEGHMDAQGTTLITTNEAYKQYQESQKALELRKKEAAITDQKKQIITPEVQSVLDTGHAYLDKIRRSNNAIPGEEISQKISKMELIVEKIFQRAKTHPEVIPDLKKMMDYYLPTTVKLLDAYESLDSQPVQGENISSSKREIEKTLDTLNVAFEKLLDSIFKDTAWDVSTDISVLNTVLAQEGLTKEDFKQGE